MTEDEVVDVRMRLEIVLCKEHESFFVFSLVRLFAVASIALVTHNLRHVVKVLALVHVTALALNTAVLSPVEGKVEEWVRMHEATCELAQGIALEDAEQNLRLPVVVTIVKTVTMCEEEYLTPYLAYALFLMQNNATLLLKVVVHPLVMVTREVVYFHSHVREFRQLAEETCVSLWHYLIVFKPEVEHIAKHIDGFRLVLYLVEKVDEASLMCSFVSYCTTSKMCVTQEVDIFHTH